MMARFRFHSRTFVGAEFCKAIGCLGGLVRHSCIVGLVPRSSENVVACAACGD